jgi:hypothetical protein
MWSVDAVAGRTLCVQTTGGRYAALTIAQVAPGGVRFDAAVWDCPDARLPPRGARDGSIG